MEPWVKVMSRAMPVCASCWNEVYPNRPAVSLKQGPAWECIVCTNPTTDGIFVRMKVEWQTTLKKPAG